jgi:hypothetical protein
MAKKDLGWRVRHVESEHSVTGSEDKRPQSDSEASHTSYAGESTPPQGSPPRRRIVRWSVDEERDKDVRWSHKCTLEYPVACKRPTEGARR